MKHHLILLSIPCLILSSCIGTKVALHSSTSTFGMDLDTTPPTTEIGLSRTEVAVQPAFAGGGTPASVMSFNGNAGHAGFFKRFFFGTGSTFATGQAAVNLTSSATGTNNTDDSISVTEDPRRPTIWQIFTGTRKRQPFGEDEMFPLITGTKTNYGLSVDWDPATQAPRAVKVGFNRKELSFAPVIIARSSDGKGYKVKLPSVLAAHQQDTQAGDGVKFDYVQYLATGKAAENLGNDSQVRKVLLKQKTQATPPPPATSGQ